MEKKEQNIVSVVFITDDNYALPTGVAIYSLIKNKHTDTVYDINVLCKDVSLDNQLRLKKCEKENAKINLIEYIDSGVFKNISETISHVNKTALCKFLLANILPNIDKILYLDSDIIVRQDLSELFNTEIDDYYLAAVGKEEQNPQDRLLKVYNMKHNFYFNSGVMLLNLQMLRKDNMMEPLIGYLPYRDGALVDQDVLNVILGMRTYHLSEIYNDCTMLNQILELKGFKRNGNVFSSKIIFECDNVVINHFASPFKPWKYKMEYYTDLFLKYYEESPFSSETIKLKKIGFFDYGKNREVMFKYPILRQIAAGFKVYNVHGFSGVLVATKNKMNKYMHRAFKKNMKNEVAVHILHYSPSRELGQRLAHHKNRHDYYPVFHDMFFDGYIRESIDINNIPFEDNFFDTAIIELRDGCFVSCTEIYDEPCVQKQCIVQDAQNEIKYQENLAQEKLGFKNNDGHIIDINKMVLEVYRTLKMGGKAFFVIEGQMENTSDFADMFGLKTPISVLLDFFTHCGFAVKHSMAVEEFDETDKKYLPLESSGKEYIIVYKQNWDCLSIKTENERF